MSDEARQLGAGEMKSPEAGTAPAPVPGNSPRAFLRLAGPVLIGQAAVMTSGVIDTVMAGHISATDLAAVGIGASIYATIFVTGMGILLALTPVVAHHYGAGRREEIGSDVRQSVWLALLLAVVAVLLMWFPAPFLTLAKPPPEVTVKVLAYLNGVAFAVPALFAFRIFYGFTTGIGRARPVMMFNLLGVSLKVPLNLVFMHGASVGHWSFPALGGAGAGWSSAVMMWVMALSAWLWCRRSPEYAPYGVFSRFDWPSWPALKELLKLGLPMGATFLIDVTAFTFMALFVARLGAEASAAHQVAVSVTVFLFMLPIAFGQASAVLVGQALGAGRPAQARQAGLHGLQIGVGVSVAAGALLVLQAQTIAQLYTNDSAVQAIATPLLRLVGFYHVVDALQAIAVQVLRGYKRATVPMFIYAGSLWGVGLFGGYVLALTDWLVPAMGVTGFWWASAAGLTTAGFAVVGYFLWIAGRFAPPRDGR